MVLFKFVMEASQHSRLTEHLRTAGDIELADIIDPHAHRYTGCNDGARAGPGHIIEVIRENGFRAEAIGYEVASYRMLANIVAAVFAALAGALLAVWIKYTGPATTLSLEIMTDVLLMVVVGGMGTMYGAVIGVSVFILMQNYLQDLMRMAATTQLPVPLLSELLSPDRWLFWLGVLFVASVYFFPSGIVGSLRTWSRKD